MLKPRPSFFATVVTTIVLGFLPAIIRAIFNFEIERFWDGTVLPYLKAHASPWIAAMADALDGFWGGVALTLLVLFGFELLFAWKRRRSPVQEQPPAASADVNLGEDAISLAGLIREHLFPGSVDPIHGWDPLHSEIYPMALRLSKAGLELPPAVYQKHAGGDAREWLTWLARFLNYIGALLRDGHLEEAKRYCKKISAGEVQQLQWRQDTEA
jgi:hypothetical protein